MESDRTLLVSGVLLLSVSALLGFVQERHRDSPEAFARWRVVHAGGAAGAVQLLALSAVWARFPQDSWTSALSWGLTLTAWAFFFGPLARALGQQATARWINIAGAVLAVPSYLLLPMLLLR